MPYHHIYRLVCLYVLACVFFQSLSLFLSIFREDMSICVLYKYEQSNISARHVCMYCLRVQVSESVRLYVSHPLFHTQPRVQYVERIIFRFFYLVSLNITTKLRVR